MLGLYCKACLYNDALELLKTVDHGSVKLGEQFLVTLINAFLEAERWDDSVFVPDPGECLCSSDGCLVPYYKLCVEFFAAAVDKGINRTPGVYETVFRVGFLVFRAVWKLLMKNNVQEGAAAVNLSLPGKILALEMSCCRGRYWRWSSVSGKRQLRNSAVHLMNIFQLSCAIFMSLLARFRAGLKEEIWVFFLMIVLENLAQPNYQEKMIFIWFLDKLCVDSQLLVDIFVNYDYDVDSSNVFERLIYRLIYGLL